MNYCMIFEVLIAVTIKIKALWVMTPCSLIDRYRSFEKNCCLNLLSLRWRQQVHPERRCLSTKLHGVMSQKTDIITY
jgi:hypothetical protein